MKKNYTLFFVALFMFCVAQTYAQQSPRVAFIEEATQASCPPCATLNPALQAQVNANPDNVIFLGYQVWWPGFDPMYNDNPGEVDERVGTYYGFNFAPQIVMQGSFVGDGSLGNLNQSLIDAVNAEMSEFDIDLNGAIENGVLTVTGSVTATAEATGNLKLRLFITEHVIYATDAPGGSNGETEYHDVFKKFIPGPAGIELAGTWAVGDTYTIDESFDLGTLNIYNYAEVEVTAIVQNDDNKFVHQAARAKDLDITVDYTNNGSSVEVKGLPEAVCTGENTITPVVTIQNTGNADLTSADIVYSVNGGTQQTFNWTGSISTLGKEDVTLDPITFVSGASNEISVSLANPNGMTDEDLSDNDAMGMMGLAPDASTEITVAILLDCYPTENSWEIRNSAGTVVASGGPYAQGQAQTQITETITIDANDCFSFNFFDSYGDGMNGSVWGSCGVDGNANVQDQYGNVIWDYDGTTQFNDVANPFSSLFVSVDETALEGQVQMSPNPTNSVLNITLPESLVDGETNVQIFSLDGKLMFGKQLNEQVSTLNLSNYDNGVYIVRVVNGEKAITERVTVQK